MLGKSERTMSMLLKDKISERMIADKRVFYCRDCFRFLLNEKRFGPHISEGYRVFFLKLEVDEAYTQKTIEEYMKALADRIKRMSSGPIR